MKYWPLGIGTKRLLRAKMNIESTERASSVPSQRSKARTGIRAFRFWKRSYTGACPENCLLMILYGASER